MNEIHKAFNCSYNDYGYIWKIHIDNVQKNKTTKKYKKFSKNYCTKK